ncbi:MAG: hypothetical protein N3G74_01030 [Candidatus Micrarchaeota archaeon]|nr:hypothetical protein [Candidatus Micrarchaeota archaeon]
MAVEFLFQLFFLIASLLALAFSSKVVLDSADKLASYFGLSRLAIGFVLISFLTSLPEFSIAVLSSFSGNNNISLGNLLGANVTNVALIFGLLLFLSIKPVKLNRQILNDMLVYLFISFLPIVLFLDGFLSLIDGAILLIIYSIFLKMILDSREKTFTFNNLDKKQAAREFLTLLIAILIVFISAEFVVKVAVDLAESLNIFESFIGATLIAFNTTIPELALTLVAARKKVSEIAIGNLIGSNIVNITLILGINVMINPFVPNIEIASLIFGFILLTSGYVIYKLLSSSSLEKRDGIILIFLYILYIFTLSSVQLIHA